MKKIKIKLFSILIKNPIKKSKPLELIDLIISSKKFFQIKVLPKTPRNNQINRQFKANQEF